MAFGQDDVLEARVQLANACRIAIRNGDAPGGGVERAVRRLAHVMRATGALPERMVIAVKEALYLGGAGTAETARYGERTVRCAPEGNLVTLAIDEYYAFEVPAARIEVDLTGSRTELAHA